MLKAHVESSDDYRQDSIRGKEDDMTHVVHVSESTSPTSEFYSVLNDDIKRMVEDVIDLIEA
jgi:hypothetical protein